MDSKQNEEFHRMIKVSVNAYWKLVAFVLNLAATDLPTRLFHFIGYGPLVNISGPDGCTPLHSAARNGRTVMVLELIRRGAEKAKGTGSRSTPLHLAALRRHALTVTAMLQAGCPVDAVDGNGFSVLHYAILGGDIVVIREILSSGCNINANGHTGLTPLHLAASKGATEAALELIQHGAKPNITADAIGTPLHQAAAGCHIETVKAMLMAGCSVNVASDNGNNILHTAAQGGSVPVIRMVYNTGKCDINEGNKSGSTPMHLAAMQGNTEATIELIKLGANLAKVAGRCGTPLHQAAMHGHANTVKAILKAGCPVDVVDSTGGSVLHAAVECGNTEVIRVLFDAGCDVNMVDGNGQTPLHCAAEAGHREAVLELIQIGAKKSIVDYNIGTPLHYAAACSHLLTVKAMLKAGCPLDVMAIDGCSVLHAAAHGGSVPIIRVVLNEGICDINKACDGGFTPLHFAAAKGNSEAALELIRAGADKGVDAGYGSPPALELINEGAERAVVAGACGTPLHQAALYGHAETVKALLKAGCPVNAVDSAGGSALHASVIGGSTQVIIELLNKGGSNVNSLNMEEESPLHWAARMGKSDIALELIRHGARKDLVAGVRGTALHQAAQYRHLSTVRTLLKAGCPVDVKCSNGFSVLHSAAGGGNVEVIQELGHVCNVNMANTDGITPLHIAACQGHTEAALKLIRLGADLVTASDTVRQPIHLAASMGNMSTVKMMLDEGCDVNMISLGTSLLHNAVRSGNIGLIAELQARKCDVNVPDSEGDSPLDYAALKGSSDVIHLLIQHGADKHAAGGSLGGPVQAAAATGNWSIVETLMKEGFSLDGCTIDGKTIMHLAAIGGNDKLLNILAGRGFSVSRTDYYGLAPLHYAAVFQHVECLKALLDLGVSAEVKAPLLGTALDIALSYGCVDIHNALPVTVSQYMIRADMRVILFDKCKKHNFSLHCLDVFSEEDSAIRAFEILLFNTQDDSNMLRNPCILKSLLSSYATRKLVDLNRLACLAAVHGDLAVLECLSEVLAAPTKPALAIDYLKLLFPVQFRKPAASSILQQVLPDCAMYPLSLAIIASVCTSASFSHILLASSSQKYVEVIKLLTSSLPYCHFLNEPMLNGLTSLDIAEKLQLQEAVDIISNAGGQHGLWASIPKEILSKHGMTILQVNHDLRKLLLLGSSGKQAVQAALRDLPLVPETSTSEQGTSTEESHLSQCMLLDRRPDLSIVALHVINAVNAEQWYRLGISLKISQAVLSHISSTHSSSENKYLKVLQCWLHQNKAVNWRTLLDILGHFETKHTIDCLTQDILAAQANEVSSLILHKCIYVFIPAL